MNITLSVRGGGPGSCKCNSEWHSGGGVVNTTHYVIVRGVVNKLYWMDISDNASYKIKKIEIKVAKWGTPIKIFILESFKICFSSSCSSFLPELDLRLRSVGLWDVGLRDVPHDGQRPLWRVARSTRPSRKRRRFRSNIKVIILISIRSRFVLTWSWLRVLISRI